MRLKLIVLCGLLLGSMFCSTATWAYVRTEVLKPNFWFQNAAGTTANYYQRADANAAGAAGASGCRGDTCVSVSGAFPCAHTKYIWGEPIDVCGTAVITYIDRPPPYNTSSQPVWISRLEGKYCGDGYGLSTGPDDDPYPTCSKVVLESAPQMCPADRYGNPIAVATGTKEQHASDFRVAGSMLSLDRDYSSRVGAFLFSFERVFLPPVSGDSSLDAERSRGCKRLRVPSGAPDCFEYLSSGGTGYVGAAGEVENFTLQSGAWKRAQVQGHETVVQVANSWVVTDPITGEQSAFNSQGLLTSIARSSGARLNVSYVPGTYKIDKVSDAFGRQLQVNYNNQNQIDSIVLPDMTAVHYLHAYTSAQGPFVNASVRGMVPLQVTYPDGTSIQYTWNEAALLGDDNYPPESRNLLTGIIDESNVRFATYRFSNGRALETQHAGGVEKWTITDPRPIDGPLNGNPVQVSDPLGSVFGVSFTAGGVSWKKTQPAGSGCTASTMQAGFDSNDNPSYRDDFQGGRICYSYDAARNVEVTRVEGITSATSCAAVMPDGSLLPAGSRKISTQRHPDWFLRTLVAEPKRITTSVYNGQRDPFNGGATASCAPSGATLPDGKPIAVLCKQVEQATTDANGSQGFSAAVDTSVPARVQQWTYDQYGQVLTATDPLNHTSTYTYYSDTTADHTLGDLATVTSALNRVVANYTQYNPVGQWLQMVDANGTTTTRTFDLRQRLKTSTTAGATTSYDYWPTGLLKTVTLPDTSSVNYGYDDAHRLTSVTDSLGNSITYTLDNAGNVTAQAVKDPAGTLSRALTQSFDALGRVQQAIGR